MGPALAGLRLSTSSFGGTIQIRISDRGPGVDRERLDDIFVPFQKLGDTDNLTGLGLGVERVPHDDARERGRWSAQHGYRVERSSFA